VQYSIRPAQTSDLAAVTDIYAEAVRQGTASFETDPPDRSEMARRFEQLRAGGFPYLVAPADGTVLGYAFAGPTAHGRPIAGRWKIRFMSRPARTGAASAAGCCAR
jgi:L-amino acid N-acyltransferase YncA